MIRLTPYLTPEQARRRRRADVAWRAFMVLALILAAAWLLAPEANATPELDEPGVCEGAPEVLGHEWQQQTRTRDLIPEVEEVSHQVYSYKRPVAQHKTEYRMAKFVRTKSKTYTKPVTAVKAQHYSWTGKKRASDDPPTVVPPHKDWQANTHHEPHGSEATWVNEHLHYTANSKGHASWFYFTPAAPGVPGGWSDWSDFSEWTKWTPESHVQWRSAPDPIGSPQKHAEWQEGNTKFYREWQVRHDGETRQVPDGHTWEYSGEVTEPRDAPWALLPGYPRTEVTTEHVPAYYTPWTDWADTGDVVRTDEHAEPEAPADTDVIEHRWVYVGTYVRTEAVPPARQDTDPEGECYTGPTPTPEPTPEPTPTEPPLECPDGKAPGWLDENGEPTSCVDDDPRPTPTEPPAECETPSECDDGDQWPEPTPDPMPTIEPEPDTDDVTGDDHPDTDEPRDEPTDELAETGLDAGALGVIAAVLIAVGVLFYTIHRRNQ